MAIHCGKCGHGPISFESISNHEEPECPKCGADLISSGVPDSQREEERRELEESLRILGSRIAIDPIPSSPAPEKK